MVLGAAVFRLLQPCAPSLPITNLPCLPFPVLLQRGRYPAIFTQPRTSDPLKPLPPPSPSTSFSARAREGEREIVYLGQIVSYLSEKERGRSPPHCHPFPQILTLLLFLFHPFFFSAPPQPTQPLHFGFSPFNQSATIRADRATGNNRGRVSGGVTSECWGVGIEGRPRQKKPPPQ